MLFFERNLHHYHDTSNNNQNNLMKTGCFRCYYQWNGFEVGVITEIEAYNPRVKYRPGIYSRHGEYLISSRSK